MCTQCGNSSEAEFGTHTQKLVSQTKNSTSKSSQSHFYFILYLTLGCLMRIHSYTTSSYLQRSKVATCTKKIVCIIMMWETRHTKNNFFAHMQKKFEFSSSFSCALDPSISIYIYKLQQNLLLLLLLFLLIDFNYNL